MLVLYVAVLLVLISHTESISIVASVRGKKFDINADTVDEVIQQVEVLADLEAGSQHVLFRGKVLSPNEKLEDAGIAAGDVLNVVKRRVQRPVVKQEDDEAVTSDDSSVAGSSFGNSGQSDFDKAYGKGLDNVSPDDMKKAMDAMERLLDSDFIDQYFADDEKLEAARLQMLENAEQYDSSMPGFSSQARAIASDPEKWREAMQQVK